MGGTFRVPVVLSFRKWLPTRGGRDGRVSEPVFIRNLAIPPGNEPRQTSPCPLLIAYPHMNVTRPVNPPSFLSERRFEPQNLPTGFRLKLELLGFWALPIVRHSKQLENTTFRKLDLFPSSCEEGKHILLDP
jgi:hypothetical protein